MVEPGAHPTLALDDTVHQRVRLGILIVLSEVSDATFGALRDQLGLTDGNLNSHLRMLEQAGLVQVLKGYAGRRPITRIRLTRAGSRALQAELATLEQLVRRMRTSTGLADGAGDATPSERAEDRRGHARS
jgi:DNA-binding MarR family transcriptional regulator